MTFIAYSPSTYRAFILGMWAEESPFDGAVEPEWRFSLESIGSEAEATTERRGFASVEELLAHLQELSGISNDIVDESHVREVK